MSVDADWEMEFAGVKIGGDTDFGLTAVSGLLDMPDIRSNDKMILRRDGLRPGDDYLGSRTVGIEFDVYGPTYTDMSSRATEFTGAFTRGDESPLTFRIPGVANGETARIYARTRRRRLDIDDSYAYGLGRAAVQLVASDPRIYTDSEQTVSTGMPVSFGGVTPNFVFDWEFAGTGGDLGQLNAVNAGNTSAPFVMRIDGPVTDPSIRNLTTGAELSFTGTVTSGNYVIVSTGQRSVLENGTQSRLSWLDPSSVWFDLAPGSNDIQFNGDVFDVAATLSATWRSAYI